MSKLLIINADDFGMSKAFNEAIVDLLENHSISTTTIMPSAHEYVDAVRLVQQHGIKDVGVHLTLTQEGYPVDSGLAYGGLTFARSLYDNYGNFFTLDKFLSLKIPSKDISEEILAQLNKVYNDGILFTHVDNHQYSIIPRKGFQGWHCFYKAYSQFERTHDKVNRGFRCAKGYQIINGTNTVAYAGRKLMPYLKFQNKRHRLITPDQVIAYPYFSSSSVQLFDTIFRSIREGLTELLVHPCRYFKGIESQNRYWDNLTNQYAHLKQFNADILRDKYGIDLVTYRDIINIKHKRLT